VAIRVEFTGRGGDRSINDRVTLVLTSSSLDRKNQKEKKENKKKKRDDENIKEKIVKL